MLFMCIYIVHLLQAKIISLNSGFKLAPPTKNPSISILAINSAAFLPVTLPPYNILIFLATSAPKFSLTQYLSSL